MSRRVIDLTEEDLADIVEAKVHAALEAKERARASPLVDSLEAGEMLGIRPRMLPRPEDPEAAAAWQRERDSKVRAALRQRLQNTPGLADLVRGQTAPGAPLYFDRRGLEDWLASREPRRRGRPRKGQIVSIKGGRNGHQD